MTAMNRSYLTIPGQQLKITVSGDAGAGYDVVSTLIRSALDTHGLDVRVQDIGHHGCLITARCKSVDEARRDYLENLDSSQRECLRGHLSALGFDLDLETARVRERDHDPEDNDISR
ncbi:hypothetical protein JT318_gp22 [Pseudomonas phage PspYZU01]|uniref:Uncharacterized protein n=1 Tax=Pseudomonas phage PspYZU01 TaxID=1983555 RepID=A0A2U7NMV3_9CAUD|nr:hypothetical protein JT318_gp22 [Pseudomonas phage PspYZU01]ASD51907.1 hypothetical protein PspYZU01_22 [Pseudomonas phage PspYZU01]